VSAVEPIVGVHDQLGDRTAAYVLGALDPAERLAFEAHLAECAICAAEVRSFAPAAGWLAHAAPTAQPDPEVRDRLLKAIAVRSPWSGSWLAMAASVLLAVALGGYAAQLRARVTGLESQLRDATRRAEASEGQMAEARRVAFGAQSQVAVLAAPDLTRIDLAGQAAAPTATARAFWSRSRGLVFTASNLPAPPPGRAYQLWVLTAQPAPISAGMLAPDSSGRVTTRFDTPLDLPRPVAMAVTLEPEGGVPAPTGDKYLVGVATN
jgi:anti-sigma-K factor RskA